jgi:hypothetical protein
MRKPSLTQIDPAFVNDFKSRISTLETQVADLKANSYTKEEVNRFITKLKAELTK